MIWKKSEGEDMPAQPMPQPLPQPPIAQPAPQRPQTKEQALIGPSIEIKGTLAGGEDLLIEGRIEGKIELRKHNVTVGKSGRVKADIHGRTIAVMGEVEGNLYGEEQIALRQASVVRGNLVAPRVTLEDGCNFKGGIDMNSAGANEKKAPPTRIEPRSPGVSEKGASG